ncbi:photosynthetic NDH subunit of lumenal location 2, chloroplastic [Apium graveolens]|uniref:photosynthetic NDH subunit of lumenal location 2, chloroplastic n=1 Tax=Apium graveolens TaxID=4045 RepID=UPI003D7B8357
MMATLNNFNHAKITAPTLHRHLRRLHSPTLIQATIPGDENTTQKRRKFMTSLVATSIVVGGLNNVAAPVALAENWGTRSFLRERFFEPGLSPEDAVARIRQTAQGLHSIRNMLETLSWRYVLFYIRLKAAYLSQDMTNAMTLVPQNQKSSYVKTANELVDNLSEFDKHVRTPRIYESYLYYEKTLKSIDELVALLA